MALLLIFERLLFHCVSSNSRDLYDLERGVFQAGRKSHRGPMLVKEKVLSRSASQDRV
jgi:hypothetical protein